MLVVSTTKYSRLRRCRYGEYTRVRGEQDGGATPSYRSEVLSLTAPQQQKCVSWPSTSGRTLEREPRHAYDLQQLDPDGQVKYGCVAVLLMAQLSTKAKAQERIQVFIYC